MNYDTVKATLETMFPQFAIEQDNDGQMVIYTGLYEKVSA